jgi:hypothetical protein
MKLLENEQITFPAELPKTISRDLARDLKFDLRQEKNEFVTTIKSANNNLDYSISRFAPEIPNEKEKQLPLYCPKVQPLLDLAGRLFGGQAVFVVVLNTQRNADWSEGPNEPVASGPLVAKFLAERLNLKWINSEGQIPPELQPRSSTWVDILIDSEAMEDPRTQEQVVARLTRLMRAWKLAGNGDGRIAVTVSGGMPPLKAFFERVPATFVGQQRVKLLEQPECGLPASTTLNYEDRVAEREALRFHCAEALRSCDYATAYGLAGRAKAMAWAEQVRNLLGPLLDLSSTVLKADGVTIKDSPLIACQIEICLCMHDIAGALKRLGLFLESSVLVLILKDHRIHQARLHLDHKDGEILIGRLPGELHYLFRSKMLEENSHGKNRHRMRKLPWLWPSWLAQKKGGQRESGQTLKSLLDAYNGNSDERRKKTSPRDYRNRLTHSSDNLDEVRTCLEKADLLQGVGKPFGKNFLALANIQKLLAGLGPPNLTSAITNQLDALLNTVIEG